MKQTISAVPFGAWLAASSWDKAALARELGVSRQTVFSWATGRHTPRDPLIRIRIADLSSGAVNARSWVRTGGRS